METGDNPSNSLDSRSYGGVESGLVVGRVLGILSLRGWKGMERRNFDGDKR